jgi:hypothetical protein
MKSRSFSPPVANRYWKQANEKYVKIQYTLIIPCKHKEVRYDVN